MSAATLEGLPTHGTNYMVGCGVLFSPRAYTAALTVVYAPSIEVETFCSVTSELDRFEDLDLATLSAYAKAGTHWFRCVGQGLEGRIS